MIGLYRRWCPVSSGTPAASAASTSRVVASTVSPTGFSTSVGTPAATHSRPPVDVQLVGRGEHDAVGPVALEELGQ